MRGTSCDSPCTVHESYCQIDNHVLALKSARAHWSISLSIGADWRPPIDALAQHR